MNEFKYRADIDGLRAVAVVLVLLFHAGFGFRGGYIGVDVFFVISGYLITGLILKEQAEGEFRLRRFWERRIRRIVPACGVLVAATLVAGGFLLLPADYADLGWSALAQSAMLSNAYFWKSSGYFDGPAELKPLLHTWSLAVEEQFYLIYPPLLVLLRRFGRGATAAVVGALAIGSFIASEWSVRHDPAGAFYLLPARAWELLLGGMLWFLPAPSRLTRGPRECLSIFGIAMILLSGWWLDAETPFPGTAALPPCVGAAVLIAANGAGPTHVGSLLASRPVVAVGLASYSLYLWHWPVLALARYRLGDEFSGTDALLALAASGGAAVLSWRFIETPFRRGRRVQNPMVLGGCVGGLVGAVVCLAGVIVYYGGIPERLSPQSRRVLATMARVRFRRDVPVETVQAGRLPKFGAAAGISHCVLWGDSHAMSLAPALDVVCRERGISGLQATYSGTLPILGHPNRREWAAPAEFNAAVAEYIAGSQVETVILAGYWSRDAEMPDFERKLAETVERLVRSGARVILVRDVPDHKIDPGRVVVAAIREQRSVESLGVMLKEHRQSQVYADEILSRLESRHVKVVDPAPYFVDAAGRCRIVMDDSCLYWDNDHLTLAGAMRLKPLFESAFADVEAEPAFDRSTAGPGGVPAD